MQITLDRMSRIVVLKAIRDRFALKPGDDLEMTLEPDGIRLRSHLRRSPPDRSPRWRCSSLYTLNLRHFRCLAPGDSFVASP